ncbi:hypothetical protein MED92_06618 [Oceanospirillum sp. MED92]|uniref:Uncharacterized protein n=1 Tax=Neptuniibacter caesariensis TaxID=207954 RepID=A0A7U8GTT2_NEPCE|nr:hypothetical protein MED92_06618 [Oceanospirillum sp. MED92] [Neptuniibacter caesariensis]
MSGLPFRNLIFVDYAYYRSILRYTLLRHAAVVFTFTDFYGFGITSESLPIFGWLKALYLVFSWSICFF